MNPYLSVLPGLMIMALFLYELWYTGRRVSEKVYRYIIAAVISYGAYNQIMVTISLQGHEKLYSFHVVIAMIWIFATIYSLVEALQVKRWSTKKIR